MAKKKIVPPPPSPVRLQALSLDTKSDKTLGYNSDIIDEVGAGEEADNSVMQKHYAQKDANFFDPYEDYVDKGTLHGGQFNVEDLNTIRATNQSNWEQAGHAVARVATNIVPQIVSGYASMVDLPGYIDAEHAANNKIVNWAMDLKQEVDQDWFPIYEEKPGQSMSLSDPAWWMSRGSGLVESVGSFLAQGYGVGKAVSLGAKGIGSVLQGRKLFAALEAIPGITSGANAAKRIGGAVQNLTTATMLNQSEAVIEATQVFNDTYKARLDEGWDYAKAKKAAAEAASTTMNLNRINILLNLSSTTAFLRGQKYTRQLLKNPTLGHASKELVKEGSQEAVEELINHVASKAGMAKGANKDYTFENALKDIHSMEGLEAAFLGAIGGIAQTGGTKALEYSKYGPGSTTDESGAKISKVQDARNRYQQQQEVINELKDKGVKVTDALNSVKEQLVFEEKLNTAYASGNVEEVKTLQAQMFENVAAKHFSAGTTEVLENLLKAESQKDPEEVGQDYVDRSKQAVKDLRTLENIYNNAEEYANVDEVYRNRASKLRAEKVVPEATTLQKEAEFKLNQEVDAIAKKHQFEQERQVLVKKDGEVVDTEAKAEKTPITYSLSDLENNTGDTDANKAVYEKFLAEVKALPSYESTNFYTEQLDSLQKQIRDLDKDHENITSETYQKTAKAKAAEKAKVEQLTKDLPKVSTISEVEKMKESTTDEDFHKAADAKIEEIKKSNDAQAKQKKTQATVAEFNTRIEKATEEELEGLLEEINNAELSQTHKTDLRNAYDRRASILNGTPVAVSPEEENPLGAFGFTNNNPNDTAEEIKREEESRATNLPKDLPNPKTEIKDVEQQVADTATKLLETDTTRVTGQDAQGNLTYAYGKSTEGHNSGAVLSREFTQTENGGIVTREESTDDIENLQVLDPEVLQSGTPLIMEVDTDYIGPKYDPSSSTRETTSWVDRLAVLKTKAEQQGIPLTQLEEYIAEVPIKVTMEDGTTVFYVHDNAWFREENLDNTPDAIAQDKANNFKIREQIIKKGKVTTKVSYKSFGHLFKAYDGSKITTSEAMPDSDLALSVCKNESLDFTKGKLLPTTLQEGRTYAIVPVGPDTYLPVPLERAPITQEIVDSIMIAVEAHLSGDTENPVVQAIGNSNLGLDITTTEGLNKYVQQFIYLYPTEKQEGIENLLINQGGSKSTLSSNRPIIAITATGIEFGKPGIQMGSYTNQDGVKVQSFAITLSKNFKKDAKTTKGLAALRAILESGNILSHTRLENLQKNLDSVILLDNQGATRTIKYSQQVKDSTVTNLRSINIGTEEAPKYVYTIQPTIKFDVTFAKLDKAKKASSTTKKKVTVPKVTVTPVAATIIPTAITSNVEAKQNLEAKLKTLDNELAKLEKDKEAAIAKAKEGDTQATVPADTTFNGPVTYLRSPISDGSLTADQATTSPELAQSMFKLTVDANNPNKGTIEFIGDKLVTKFALDFPELSIEKVSDYLNSRGQVEGSPGIITVRKGIVEKKGDKWVVVQKAKIAFGATNNTASSFEPLLKSTSPSDQAAIDKKVSAIKADFKNKSNTVTTQKEAIKKELAALEQTTEQVKLEASDKVVFGHPGIGKSHIRQNNKDIIDFDEDYKTRINEKYNLEEGFKARNEWRKANPELWDQEVKALWEEAKAEAKKTNKRLFASDMLLLREFANDFDKVITMSKDTFVTRAKQRDDYTEGETESWKDNLDKTISTVDQNKVITTDKYLSDLLPKTTEQVIANSPIPSAEQQVEEAVDPAVIMEQTANQVLNDYDIDTITGFLDNLNVGEVTEDVVKEIGFESLEQAKQVFNRAKEIHKKNSEKKTTFQFPGKKNITVDGNTKDSTDISEDTFDYLISPLNEEQVDELNAEVEAMIIRGVDSETQRSLIAYISAEIIQKTLAEKEVGGARTVKVKDIMDTNKEYFIALAEYYKENGLPNKAKRLEAVVEQFDKVDRLVQQYMSLLTTGTVTSKPKTDSEESVGLEKTLYTDDWAFTIDSKSTASGDLKKFFANIQAQDKDGLKQNSLGLEEIMPFDAVYDTLHEILANKPADYTTMMEVLKLYAENFPWINSVVESIEKAPERIKNEFVSDMAKHHIEMSFVMWERNKNGTYNLQRWSSNSASKENRLRAMWQSNLRGVGTSSNIVVVNDEDEYVFDHVVVDRLITQAEKFAEDPSVVTNDDIANWLGQLGIVLADDTYDDLRNGLFNNKGKKTFNQLFTHSQGLFKVLTAKLKTISNGRPKPGKPNTNLVENANLMTDSVVKALAKLDATNSLNTSSNSFQSGGKTVYSYSNNNYLVNRMRDLTAHNGEKFINEELIKHLQDTSFTKDSLWLKDITSTDALGEAARRELGLNYLSLEALKKKFTPSQDDRKLNNLTPAEHEVIKLGLFLNNSGQTIGKETRRSVQFFYPTMSDKTTMLSITALARELTLEEGVISKDNIKLLFDALVQPEINRIRDKQASDIKGYEPNYFYFLPALNTELITINGKEKTVLDFVKDKDDSIYSQEFKDQVEAKIKEIYEQLVEDKLKDWKTLGIGKTVKDNKGRVSEQYMFLNSSYMADVAKGIGEAKVKYAAMDYIFNSLIANSESFKLFAGDPALYAKFKKDKTLQQNLEETFINIGKRLAGDIAPGIELANSANNKYLQVFLEDKELNSNNVNDSVQLEYFSKIMKDYKKNYSGIEGSDAQEYTTWQEHIYVMKQLGRITDNQFEVFNRKLTAQTDKAAKSIPLSKADKLTYEELGLVMQPIKPVYVGNIAVTGDNVDRRIYIKSSSFPLIPELTAGLQIEKARKALEKFEAEIGSNISSDGNPAFVRASFGTANKVGAVKNAVKLFDDKGNVNDNLEIKEENSLVLNRSNFRIQQDVPYKREKNEINVGSQEMKLLFVNLLDVQVDENHTGEQLLTSYNQAYKELYEYANEKLAERLGLVTETTSTPELVSLLETPTTTAVADTHALKESLKGKSTVQNVIAKQKFSEEKGENTIDRVKFIDKNFDKIVASLLKDEQIKVLFQDENNQNKKCE